MSQKAENPHTLEANFDGLVGPTHNYSGLSYGNIASTANRQTAANPREAALQGLEKMLFLKRLGCVQGVFPPHERPYLPLLRLLGYRGDDADIWRKAAKESSTLINACASAAAMWTANAATVTPSADSSDAKAHFTPANLSAKLHRSIEPATTAAVLNKIFNDPRFFTIHDPLPSGAYFSDEGAANHTRLCRTHGEKGIHLFAWGKSSLENTHSAPKTLPARQTLEASQAIARRHNLDPSQAVFAQQSPKAIDAGVFHNDVISVGNQGLFFYHEDAFAQEKKVLEELVQKFEQTTSSSLVRIRVSRNDVSLDEAVSTYLFNSQLLTLPDGSMAMIAPSECEKNARVSTVLKAIIEDPKIPIASIHYLNLHESMRNGGGPACLRLRVVLTKEQLQATHQGVFLTDKLYNDLKAWIVKRYRDRLYPQDLADPSLILETRAALDELTQILGLGSIYEFQR